MFDLAVFAVPTDNVLLTALNAVRIRKPVNQVVTELMPEGLS